MFYIGYCLTEFRRVAFLGTVTAQNDHRMAHGKCPHCDTKVVRILKAGE